MAARVVSTVAVVSYLGGTGAKVCTRTNTKVPAARHTARGRGVAKQFASGAAPIRQATGICGHCGPKTRSIDAGHTVSACDAPHIVRVRRSQAIGTSGGVARGASSVVVRVFGESLQRGVPVATRCMLKQRTRGARPLRVPLLRKLAQLPRRMPSGHCASFLAVTRRIRHMQRSARDGQASIVKQWVGVGGLRRSGSSVGPPHCSVDCRVIK